MCVSVAICLSLAQEWREEGRTALATRGRWTNPGEAVQRGAGQGGTGGAGLKTGNPRQEHLLAGGSRLHSPAACLLLYSGHQAPLRSELKFF